VQRCIFCLVRSRKGRSHLESHWDQAGIFTKIWILDVLLDSTSNAPPCIVLPFCTSSTGRLNIQTKNMLLVILLGSYSHIGGYSTSLLHLRWNVSIHVFSAVRKICNEGRLKNQSINQSLKLAFRKMFEFMNTNFQERSAAYMLLLLKYLLLLLERIHLYEKSASNPKSTLLAYEE